MEDTFKLEIISPEKVIFSGTANMITFPAYEGDMSVLKNHISLITFLKPGIIKVQKKEGNIEEFFVKDGTVEFFDNNFVMLSASVINIKDLSKDIINNINKNAQEKLLDKNITDHDRYTLNHELDVIKNIRV